MAQAKTEAMAGLDNGNSTEADMQEDLQEGMQGNQQRKVVLVIEDNKSIPLKNVAFDCGFSEYSHFAKSFKSIVGVPPSEYGREKKI